MKQPYLTLANALSFFRILPLSPLIVLAILYRDQSWLGLTGSGWFACLAAVAFVSDYADGFVARRWGQTSELGKLLDPLGDKVIFMTAIVTMILIGIVPPWFGAAVLARDVFILAGALWLRYYHQIKQIPPSRWLGSIYVNVLPAALLAYFYDWSAVVIPFTVLTVLFLILSFGDYASFFYATAVTKKLGGRIIFKNRIS